MNYISNTNLSNLYDNITSDSIEVQTINGTNFDTLITTIQNEQKEIDDLEARIDILEADPVFNTVTAGTGYFNYIAERTPFSGIQVQNSLLTNQGIQNTGNLITDALRTPDIKGQNSNIAITAISPYFVQINRCQSITGTNCNFVNYTGSTGYFNNLAGVSITGSTGTFGSGIETRNIKSSATDLLVSSSNGSNILKINTAGDADSIFLGRESGGSSSYTTGGNVLLGYQAGRDRSSFSECIGIGRFALQKATSGSQNFAIGSLSMNNITTGTGNLGFGHGAGVSVGSSSNNNIAIGIDSLRNANSSFNINRNTMIGTYTGGTIQSSNNDNIHIGHAAGRYLFGSNNVIIGTDQNLGVITQSSATSISNKFILNNGTNATLPLCYGDFVSKELTINNTLKCQNISGATGYFEKLAGVNYTGSTGYFTNLAGVNYTGSTGHFTHLQSSTGVFTNIQSSTGVFSEIYLTGSIIGSTGFYTSGLNSINYTGSNMHLSGVFTGSTGFYSNSIISTSATGSISLLPTGKRTSTRCNVQFNTLGNNACDFDLRHVESGDFYRGWQISARNSTDTNQLQFYFNNPTSASGPDGYSYTLRGSISSTDGVYTPSSDVRLKKDIEPLNYGLNELLQLQPRRYKMKDDDTCSCKIGFIAQEVLPIVPESVVFSGGEEDFLLMNYATLVPVLTNSIKELNSKIEMLEKRLSNIE